MRSLVSRRALLALFLLSGAVSAEVNDLGQEIYDIDSSWAIKSTNLTSTLGNKQELYDDFINRCLEAAGPDAWSCNDEFRIKMDNFQPMSMRNYTKLGFKKIRAPDQVRQLLTDFWEANKDNQYEEWSGYNVYHNLWDAPSTMADVQNRTMVGGGAGLRQAIWDAAKDILEEWTGQYLVHCSLWGIRVYHEGSILAPHVDRNPLVSSAIINVAQDVDEPWPLEVWGHDGKPYNITMEPGDMVLYESHSVIHGRPFPLEGKYYANIFVHYEPVGAKTETGEIYLNEEAEESRAAGLPPYIIPGSPWEEEWHSKNPEGWKLYAPINPHMEARQGNLEKLKITAAMNKTELDIGDMNGWTPLHEAVRAGKVDAVKFLLENGADIDAITNGGQGYSPLKLAEMDHGKDSPVADLLRNMGGHAFSGYDEL